MTGYSFFVRGVPATKGSKSLMQTKSGRYIMVEAGANKLKKWMRAISSEARCVFEEPMEGAIHLVCRFYFERPKSVKKRKLPHVRPDLDKLLRAVNDALQGIAFKDDGQVTTIISHKYYATLGALDTGVLIEVFRDEKKESQILRPGPL